ncbi:site-specific integrase [Microvirga sp. 3-52]|uniref:site-specific integrase n=1 Tax=Microvirga sp. 3-52 TaxID=2792425 RepID=UPI00289A12A1|nr:site-specific integrase [Microvirga sp. 3-52]
MRRGAVYCWRRRLPACGANGRQVLQISLQSTHWTEARRIGAELTAMSELVFDEMRRGRLSQDEAKAILVAVALRHAAKLELVATVDRAREAPEPMSSERADRVNGAVYRLLAERGRTADGPIDAEWLRSCGLDPSEADQVKAVLKFYRQQGLVPPKPVRLQSLIAEHAPDVGPSAIALAQAENAFYRGMAAALFHSAAKWGAGFPEDIATAFGSDPVALSPLPTAVSAEASPPPVAPSAAKAEPEQKAAVQASIADLAEKLCATKLKLREWTDKTCRQMRQTAGLLVKEVGHDDLTRLRQADMAAYVDTLLALPKSYGKSSRDVSRPLKELLAAAKKLPENQRGLEGPSINRHLTHLGNLVDFAVGRGLRPAEALNLTTLRARKKGRDRDDRAVFTAADLMTVFDLPVWRGCRGEGARLEPGTVVVHDGLYWAPLIAAYSLMRREEICGLMIADIHFDGGIPYFEVRPNKYRRLKNAQSKRKLPIHPELLRLGLRDYVEAIRQLGYDLLFPDLLPASGNAPLGDQLHDGWAPALARALPTASGEGKTFHSIRHFGNDALIDAKVMLEWRQDIMGHSGVSETDERYRDETRLARKLSALRKLPTVTASLQPARISLRETVVEKIGRRSRRRPSGRSR